MNISYKSFDYFSLFLFVGTMAILILATIYHYFSWYEFLLMFAFLLIFYVKSF